jgi:hypothetical protein
VTTPEDPLRAALISILRRLEHQEGDWGHLTPESLADLLIAAGVALAAPPVEVGEDGEERSLAYAALGEAIRHAGMLRTESVTIQAPLARYLLAALRSTAPALDVERLARAWWASINEPEEGPWEDASVSGRANARQWARELLREYVALEGAQGGD